MFEKIVSDLVSTGLTEKQIAELVGSSQSSINRLRHGKHTPQWPLGDSLVKLHAARCQQPVAAPDAMFPPISRSEKLKVEFAPLVSAMHRAMTGFAPGGNWGGVAELSHLVDEPDSLLRNQYGPSVYDHAPTLHGFLSIYSLLKPLPVAMELCRLADCIALPVSPEVDLDKNGRLLCKAALAMSTLTDVTQALSQGSRLDAEAHSKARDAVFEVVAFASALLARIDPAAMIAPSPHLDEDALAFAAAVQVSFSD